MGRAIGEALASLPHKWLLLPIGLFIGFVTTWGEPAVRILVDQVEKALNGSIRGTMILVAISVGVARDQVAELAMAGEPQTQAVYVRTECLSIE
jgi:hypothetical protein